MDAYTAYTLCLDIPDPAASGFDDPNAIRTMRDRCIARHPQLHKAEFTPLGYRHQTSTATVNLVLAGARPIATAARADVLRRNPGPVNEKKKKKSVLS